MLRFGGDSSPPTAKDTKSASTSSSSSTSTAKETKPPKLTAEMVVGWSKSFDSLLADKCMLHNMLITAVLFTVCEVTGN